MESKSNLIFLGRYGVVWLVNLTNRLLVAASNKEIVANFNEASRAFLI